MSLPEHSPVGAPTSTRRRPCVVQYLYTHTADERFSYPTGRSHGAAATAARYLECVLVQTSSLRRRGVDCDVMLVSNMIDPASLGPPAARLLESIQSLGVELVFADYRHRPLAPVATFMSSQYVFDAILAASDPGDPARELWLTDADCVWVDPGKVFAAAPPAGRIGCIHIPYPPDWDVNGVTPRQIGDIAGRLGIGETAVRWVGGELLTGAAGDLRELVSTCKSVEREAVDSGVALNTEEHLLSLAGALGRATFDDLSAVARRILTGPRQHAPPVAEPAALGLWHLPSEKGLSFRRGASAIVSGRGARLIRDLDTPTRALRQFNVAGAGWPRRARDDFWIVRQQMRRRLGSRRRAR